MEAAEWEDAANDEEEDAALVVVVAAPLPSDFHMEEGDAGLFMAVAIAALDCCQNVLADDTAVVGCCC